MDEAQGWLVWVKAGLSAHDAGSSREQENITTAVQTEVNGRVRPPRVQWFFGTRWTTRQAERMTF